MSTDALPSFSIIVPTYQRRDLVAEMVRTLTRQRYGGKLELIVVVDGSTDGTTDALGEIAMPFPMRVIEQANLGLAAARNAGASKAEGEVLLFLDDDMLAEPDLVLRHAQSISGGADAVVGAIPLDERSPPGFLTQGVSDWANDWSEEADSIGELTAFNVIGGQISVKREVFEALGGFAESFTAEGRYGKEDADFGSRLLSRFKVVYNAAAVSRHRYIVTPKEYIERGYQTGRADVQLANRHPHLAHELQSRAAATKPLYDRILQPLARLPFMASIAKSLLSPLADLLLASRFRDSAHFARLFFAGRRLNYWAGVHAAGGFPRSRKVLILCYHAVRESLQCRTMADYNMPPGIFADQMDNLHRRGFTFVTARQVLEMLRDGTPLPARSVLISFDDCYVELLSVARDILAPRSIPALAFAVTGIASQTNEWDHLHGADKLEIMGWDQLRQLEQSGFEIGSHSRTHADLTSLQDAQLADEIAGSADDFAEAGLARPALFAFPFGCTNECAQAAVKQAGYQAAFGLAEAFAAVESNRYNIERVEILRRDIGWRFWLKTRFPYLSRALRWREILGNRKRRLLNALGLSRKGLMKA